MIVAVLAMGVNLPAKASDWQLEAVAGINFATVDHEGIGFRHGFHSGLRLTREIPKVTPGFYVNAAALLSLKGFKTDSVSYNPFFLDIPIHAGYKYEIDDNIAMFAEGGPYIGVGLFGKRAGKNVFSDVVGYKRFDFGIGVRGGIQIYKRYSISVGGDFGFLRVTRDFSSKPRNVFISLGYRF